jgi:hypothetical protein
MLECLGCGDVMLRQSFLFSENEGEEITFYPALVSELQRFVHANSFVDLYKAYSWQNDTYVNGFPDICTLEARLMRSDLT